MDNTVYTFTDEEKKAIQAHTEKYPDKRSAVMPALWIAQEKYGWLPNDAIKLVANTLDLPYSHVYGVATFYTMYLKKDVAPNLIEVCTCFSCGEVGGPEMYHFLREHLEVDEQGKSKDGKIWVRQAECLGACDTAPMCQVNNGRYVHNLTEEKVKQIVSKIQKGEKLSYEQVPLSDQSVIED
ncbi:MAG: NADH-quinone oxidoreductase subunit NuoE [Bacteroidota bacterium]